VLDVPVPQIMLDGPGVLAVVGQLEAGGMSQHMRVDRHAQPGCLAGAGDQLAEGGRGHHEPFGSPARWSTTIGNAGSSSWLS